MANNNDFYWQNLFQAIVYTKNNYDHFRVKRASKIDFNYPTSIIPRKVRKASI